MIDPFVILAPILLLGVVALLGFVGCDVVLGLERGTPQNLRATAGNAQVVLEWDPYLGVTRFKVYRGTKKAGPYPTSFQPAGTVPSFTDDTPINGTAYYYVVTAVFSDGETGYSNEAEATPNTIAEVGDGSQRALLVADQSDAPVTQTFRDDVTANNLLIVCGAMEIPSGTVNAPTVTDSVGTDYTETVFFARHPSRSRLCVFLAYGRAGGSGTNEVTVASGQLDTSYSFVIDEFSGVHSTPLDADGGSNPGNSMTPNDSLTTLTHKALLIGCLTWFGGGIPTLAPGSGYAEIDQQPDESGNLVGMGAEFKIAGGAGAQTVDWTFSASKNWIVYTAAFRQAAQQ